MSQPTLTTPRLRLRPFREADAEDLHQILGDPVTMQYWSDHYETLEDTAAFVRAVAHADPATTCDFVIEYEGRAIGKAGMWKLPEIGFFLHPVLQGKGIMREALTAIIPHLFATYGMDALTADVDPRNDASIGLLTSLGFRETHRAERTIQLRGEWCDSVYFALDCKDWSLLQG